MRKNELVEHRGKEYEVIDFCEEMTIFHPRILNTIADKEYGLMEYKFVDIYLSLLKQQISNDGNICITKANLERAIGSQMKMVTINRILENMATAVHLSSPDDESALHTSIFSTGYEKKQGRNYIFFMPNKDLLPHFLNPKSYQPYPIGVVCRLKSIYSLRMFWYLLDNSFRGSWEVDVILFRYLLKDETETDFSTFRKNILQKVKDDLAGGGVHFSYDIIRGDRNSAEALRFYDVEFPKSKDFYAILAESEHLKLEKQGESDLVKWIQEELNIDENGAKAIWKKAHKNRISEDEIKKRVRYVTTYQGDVRNKVGLAISLMDDRRWSEISRQNNTFSDFGQKDMSEEMSEMEKFLLMEVNS